MVKEPKLCELLIIFIFFKLFGVAGNCIVYRSSLRLGKEVRILNMMIPDPFPKIDWSVINLDDFYSNYFKVNIR